MTSHGTVLAVVLGTLALVSLGCGDEKERAPGISDCVGECPSGGGVGVSPQPEAGTDAQDSGDAAVTSFLGQVVVFQDTGFSQMSPFMGSGLVYVPTSSGQKEVPVAGDAGVFTADDVLVGYSWFTVVPDTASVDAGPVGTVLVPTWSAVDVQPSAATSKPVPLMNVTLLNTIYSSLSSPTVAGADAAQVVVVFERDDGQRVSNVTIVNAPTSEHVAYDVGLGGYSEEATATGDMGVAILVNAIGAGEVEWQHPEVEGSFSLQPIAGQVFFVRLELP
jgi:hypothetical protein